MSNYSPAVNYVKPDSMLQRSTRDVARHATRGELRCFENGFETGGRKSKRQSFGRSPFCELAKDCGLRRPAIAAYRQQRVWARVFNREPDIVRRNTGKRRHRGFAWLESRFPSP